jgi:HD superfamily phosphodiesterase
MAPLGDRWLHVQAVADKAHRVAAVLPAEDADLLVAAAFLHDVGCARPWTGSASIRSTAQGSFAPRGRSDWPAWSRTTPERA